LTKNGDYDSLFAHVVLFAELIMKVLFKVSSFFCTVIATALLVITISSCSNNNSGELVGISMPTQSSERWQKDASIMKSILEEQGFQVDLQFAEDDVPTQITQIKSMLAKGAKVLVIAAIDGATLSDTLEEAVENGVYVIAYDRLIVDTDAVSYYISFDSQRIGELQAQSLIDGLNYDKAPGPFNIELFSGPPDDPNSFYFFYGAMSILQPMFDTGELIILSGQRTLEETTILSRDSSHAQRRMESLLENYYSNNTFLHGVLSPHDSISQGLIDPFASVGYNVTHGTWPIITGQDASPESIKMIISGEQYSTILKNTNELARATANMVEAILDGRDPKINDTTTNFNNVKFVPSYMLVPVTIDESNYQLLVIDSGFMSEDDIG